MRPDAPARMPLTRRLALTLVSGLAGLAGAVAVAGPAVAAEPTAAFVKTSDWGTGWEGKYTITNAGTTTVSGWNVQLDLPAGTTVGSFWDATMTSSGTHYTFTNLSWNGTVAPGATASFGFIGAGPGSPANCTLNGAPCTGGSTVPGAPGVPTGLRVSGSTGSSVTLAWTASTGTVSGYRIYEGSTVRATVNATSATVSGLGSCTTHSYAVAAFNGNGESARGAAVSATTNGCPTPTGGRGAPYLYLGWGDPPSPATVMNATGVRWFTMAFVLSGGGCTPAWDSTRPITGGTDATVIAQIRAAGGDIVPSFGGWSGNKLGPNCATPEALAGAYQKVIDAYALKAIDIDIENSDEFENEVVQDRILNALKLVKQRNPGIQTIVTFGTGTTGPNFFGNRLITRAAAIQANLDVFTIMPFDFGGSNIFTDTVNASEGLKNALKAAFGWSDATAYTHMGISGMNGLSDQRELTTTGTWTQIRDWARARGLARLAFWSVNRDRGCADGGVAAHCSGIGQSDWDFTRITAGF